MPDGASLCFCIASPSMQKGDKSHLNVMGHVLLSFMGAIGPVAGNLIFCTCEECDSPEATYCMENGHKSVRIACLDF